MAIHAFFFNHEKVTYTVIVNKLEDDLFLVVFNKHVHQYNVPQVFQFQPSTITLLKQDNNITIKNLPGSAQTFLTAFKKALEEHFQTSKYPLN